MRALLFIVIVALCPAQEPNARVAEKRHALVIGNSNYGSLPKLPMATAEARTMVDVLKSAGFNVVVLENVKNDSLFNEEAAFLARIKPGDTCFFYYSGHAAQVPDDDNYLLPVDFNPASRDQMQDRAFRLTRLIQDLDDRKAGLKILVLEAPRKIDAPIPGAAGLGLFMPDTSGTSETLVAMAARAGQYIRPLPPGQIGLFTRAVADRIARPGLTLSLVFEQAKQEVGRSTAQQQFPDWNSSVLGEGFYFHPPVVTSTPSAPTVTVIVQQTPTNSRDRQEYVYLPPGKFKMGCVPADTRCEANEKPQHDVTIGHGLWMGRTEVDVRSFQRYVEESGKKSKMPKATIYNPGWKNSTLPMMMVSWDEAGAYCAWAGGRLPTEAEWEYAARGGKQGEIYPLNDENSREKANFYGKKGNDKFEQLAPVHSFDQNPYNLFDMAGNVWEWVADWYAPGYRDGVENDPKGPAAGKEHVVRGGSFESDWKQHLRLSFRRPQGGPAFHVGFRCVMDDTPETKTILKHQ